ncbi:RluA family pseudouridine synthase [Pseudovibrio exalbescens]|uniref:RluA family pseudouridine synthase n=1 Tax=Pseudovibrio exalbescens TaxID=197461 RepID=UPI002365D9C6|nr:RluA family pseudouridine synthase [Pseudovibrio exalbescens]MDD7911034.1 RluA family pseudouridine synthase [Pseudovibrio exalbescens]
MADPNPPFIYNPPTEPFLDVLHQDDDILVLNKPSGLLSVPGKADHLKDCLERRAQGKFGDARIVHRLDMDTSGVIVMAMNAQAHRHLGLQFERRKTRKTYIARIWGQPEKNEGLVDLPLRCDWPNRPRQMVDHELGRSAQTKWEVLAREEACALVRLSPITGRSHQLRVHMLSLGHPILGDRFYAGAEALAASNRLCLHAHKLGLHHPANGEFLWFEAPVPF